MTRLYSDIDKFGDQCSTPVVEAFHLAVKDMVRRKFEASGTAWNDFVFGPAFDLITADDFRAIDQRLVDYGHRYVWSAVVSQTERPQAYIADDGVTADLSTFSFEHPDAPTAAPDAVGLALCGLGDNVVSYAENLVGVARYIRSSAMVLSYLNDGVPPGTIAVIDDSGGTLTAPILEQFTGVLCAGGTVRSHLGILTREYGIPCFMNAKLSGIKDGDTVHMECTATAKTAENYQKGVESTGRVWRVVK